MKMAVPRMVVGFVMVLAFILGLIALAIPSWIYLPGFVYQGLPVNAELGFWQICYRGKCHSLVEPVVFEFPSEQICVLLLSNYFDMSPCIHYVYCNNFV